MNTDYLSPRPLLSFVCVCWLQYASELRFDGFVLRSPVPQPSAASLLQGPLTSTDHKMQVEVSPEFSTNPHRCKPQVFLFLYLNEWEFHFVLIVLVYFGDPLIIMFMPNCALLSFWFQGHCVLGSFGTFGNERLFTVHCLTAIKNILIILQ